MMRIITIDREFGSGGRELGKRLSESLQIPCYDQEIIEEVARLHKKAHRGHETGTGYHRTAKSKKRLRMDRKNE